MVPAWHSEKTRLMCSFGKNSPPSRMLTTVNSDALMNAQRPGHALSWSPVTKPLHADKVKALLEETFKQAQILYQSADRVEIIAEQFGLEPDDVEEWLSYTKWGNKIELKKNVLAQTTDTLKDLGLVHQKFKVEDTYHEL